jgi:hypothetical protein
MRYETYEGWIEAGYVVEYGSKSTKRLGSKAVFSEEQVIRQQDQYPSWMKQRKDRQLVNAFWDDVDFGDVLDFGNN